MIDSKTDLNQLVIFAKVVETRSFTAAGRQLGLPKSTVSRKIAQLEERLGVRLLQRTTRKLSLTEVGAAFYERCARISSEIEEAEHAVRRTGEGPQGRLRICAPPELGARFLSEVVGEYLLAHVEVEVEVELTARRIDLIEEGFDIALRIDPSSDPSLLLRKLGPLPQVLVASPMYLADHGVPQRPEQLVEHAVLVLGARGREQTILELQRAGGDALRLELRPRLVANDTVLLREAALAGAGVCMLPIWECAADLQAGRLQSLLREWTRGDAVVHAAYPTARHLSAKVRSFLDFLAVRLEPPARVGGNGSMRPHEAAQLGL